MRCGRCRTGPISGGWCPATSPPASTRTPGRCWGEAVHAGVTVTFTCAKPGHYLGDGAEYTGELRIRDIGIPDELLFGPEARERFPVEAVEGTFTIPRRKPNSHKGDYGRLFLLAGSEGYTGAPVLAASAAVRSGAGLE